MLGGDHLIADISNLFDPHRCSVVTAVTVVPRGYRSTEHPPVEVVGCAFVDTPDGHEALWAAADLTRRTSGRLRVVTAVAPVAEFSTFSGPETERAFTDSARAAYQRALDAAVAAVADQVPVTGELLEGGVPEALAALDPRDVDVLVCGSAGTGRSAGCCSAAPPAGWSGWRRARSWWCPARATRIGRSEPSGSDVADPGPAGRRRWRRGTMGG